MQTWAHRVKLEEEADFGSSLDLVKLVSDDDVDSLFGSTILASGNHNVPDIVGGVNGNGDKETAETEPI